MCEIANLEEFLTENLCKSYIFLEHWSRRIILWKDLFKKMWKKVWDWWEKVWNHNYIEIFNPKPGINHGIYIYREREREFVCVMIKSLRIDFYYLIFLSFYFLKYCFFLNYLFNFLNYLFLFFIYFYFLFLFIYLIIFIYIFIHIFIYILLLLW